MVWKVSYSSSVRPRPRPDRRPTLPARFLGRACCLGLAAAWMTGALLLSGQTTHAHKRAFVWSYEWFTPMVGEKELELWATYKDEGSTWEKQLEYEFATSPRHGLGLYLIFDNSSAGELGVNGWKVESRYRFGEFQPNRWLHGSYLEVKKKEGEPYELEGKWLLSRYNRRDDALAVNLVVEKALESGADIEYGYTLGWSRRVNDRLRLGVESFGEFKDGEYYLGPNIAYDFTPQVRLVLGAAAGLTNESDDLVLRVVAEREW